MVENVTDNSNPGVEIGKSGAGDSSLSVSPKTSHNNDLNGSVDTSFARQSPAIDMNICEKNTSRLEPQKATGATVQILKRPSRAFGALLGNSNSKKKVDPTKTEKELTKLKQIKSSVSLPFPSFVGDIQTSKNDAKTPSETMGDDPMALNDAQGGPSEAMDACPSEENHESKMEDVIPLEGNSDDNEAPITSETAASERAETRKDSDDGSGPDDEDKPMSLSDLSSTLSKCLQSSNQNQQQETAAMFQPFDYQAARKTTKFGEPGRGPKGADANGAGVSKSGSKSKRGGVGGEAKPDQARLLPKGRRRQAFPASGNRSPTFL